MLKNGWQKPRTTRQTLKDFSERIQALEEHVEEARKKITEIRDSGEDQLRDLKARIDEWLPGGKN